MDHCLVADIGGTNARIGLVMGKGGQVNEIEQYSNRDFPSLDAVIRYYLDAKDLHNVPMKACFAVASPVMGDHIAFTNNSWSFHIPTLRDELGFKSFHVMNDFEAIARSLSCLSDKDLLAIAPTRGKRVSGHTMAVVGPGTGLGVGALVPSGKGSFVPLPSEGGHASFHPIGETEIYISDVLRREHEFVCIEDVMCGPGLENIYRILALRESRSEVKVAAKDITDRAVHQKDPLALETLATFCAMLGSVAGDLALTLGACGGVFIAGGIVPRFPDFLEKSAFRERFEAKGRYRAYVEEIPSYVIIGKQPGLIGAATYFDNGASLEGQ